MKEGSIAQVENVDGKYPSFFSNSFHIGIKK